MCSADLTHIPNIATWIVNELLLTIGRFHGDWPLSTHQQPVLVDQLEVSNVLWAEASAVEDLHAACVKHVCPLTSGPKLTVPQKEVLAHMQTGTLRLKSAGAVYPIALVVMRAYLEGFQRCFIKKQSFNKELELR